MIEVYKEQIENIEEVVPNFKVANATIHFDESSPHLTLLVYEEDLKAHSIEVKNLQRKI